MGRRGHILALPYPAPDHVSRMMALCRVIENHGFKITFVNTEFIHKRVVSAQSLMDSNIDLVSIPDGLDPEDERKDSDYPKLCEAMLLHMPAKLEQLVRRVNATSFDDEDQITCFITEFGMSWALEVAYKMGIRGATYWPLSATYCTAIGLARNQALEKVMSVVDETEGGGRTQFSEDLESVLGLPNCDLETMKRALEYGMRNIRAMDTTDWWLCNSAYELEADEFARIPKLLPIGPFPPECGDSRSLFFPEDDSCIDWLDQHPPCSVIYVAFSSVGTLEPTQFVELALGLDLSNRPFLWVGRPKITGSEHRSCLVYPNEFRGTRGKIVTWAPQPKVLNHPSTACFLSNCDWPSTTEGLCSAVPFLCLPFISDQPFNMSYICDAWKVGVRLDPDENGIIPRSEIKNKVEQLLGDESIRARSSQLRTKIFDTIAGGGRSSKNFNSFINWLKLHR
ncbi:hypothetical protein I3760_04G057000 [Carya illinoinensis]|nr:hypothetical protein I3760_04G057000 [Carya illinoinensis]